MSEPDKINLYKALQ